MKNSKKTIMDVPHSKCSGCMMCGDVCPKDAITYPVGEDCFWYPSIDMLKCISCGICYEKCPAMKDHAMTGNIDGNDIFCIGAKTRDEEIRWNSTSGGFYSEIATDWVRKGASVCGAIYDENNMVIHAVGNDEVFIKKTRQSKYAQSRMAGNYRKVKKLVSSGRKIVFTGTPCQVEALHSYLGKKLYNSETLLVIDFICQMITAFAANARIAFSDPSATVGGKIKVNMKITSSDNLANADVMLSYDSNILEFVDGTNADGGAGAVRVHGDAGTPNTGTLAFTLNFNAIAAGTSKIEVTSQEIYDSNSQIVTVNQQGNSTVTVSALQSASKDATLKSLQISPGSLTPAFSPDVDTYAVTVGTDVDKVIVSADCTDENATKVVSGNEGLQMGENRVTCRVTAQDGETIKEYVIVVTKAEGGASAADADASSQVRMRIAERVITILPPDPEVKVPEGFKESTINIDGHKVQGWVWGSEAEHQYCVVYGMNEAGEKGFYRYDMKDDERTIQRYFEDPAISGSVTKEVYDELALTYDKIYDDYSLLKILLIVTIVIAIILLVILLVVVFTRGSGKKGGSRDELGDKKDGPRGSRGRNSRKEKAEEPELLENSEDYQEYAGEDEYQDSDEYDESREYEDDSVYDDDEDYRDLPEEDYPVGEEDGDIYDEEEDDYEPEEEPQVEIPVKKPVKPARPVQAPAHAPARTPAHAPVQTPERTPAQAPSSRQKPPVKQEQPSGRREAEQVPAKPDGQDDDFEIFDL